MRTVVFNRKGGVGKSTVAANLAAIDAERGRRTLLVDLDPQGNATRYVLGDRAGEVRPTLSEFFEQALTFRIFPDPPESWVHRSPWERLDVVASSGGLAELEARLEARWKMNKLRDLLDELPRYEVVWIDTPPALGFFTLSALIAADRCLIPFDCDAFSRRALDGLIERVDEIREDHRAAVRVAGIVVNQFQSRARLPARMVEEIEGAGLPVLRTRLSHSVVVRESHEACRPLIHWAPGHKVTLQFRELHDEIERRDPAGARGATAETAGAT